MELEISICVIKIQLHHYSFMFTEIVYSYIYGATQLQLHFTCVIRMVRIMTILPCIPIACLYGPCLLVSFNVHVSWKHTCDSTHVEQNTHALTRKNLLTESITLRTLHQYSVV